MRSRRKREKKKVQGLGSSILDTALEILSSIFLFWK